MVGEHFPDLRRPFASPPPLCSLVDFSGEDESVLRAAIETALAAAIESGDALDAAISNSESQRRDFWALREAIPLARARTGKWAQIDAALPVAAVADFIAAVESKFAPRCDGQIALYGHAGDGNLHIGFRPLGKSPTENPTAAAAMRDEILEEIYRRGGSFSAEHGIGQTKNGAAGAAQKSRRVARDGGDQARARSARNDESGQSVCARIDRVIATENIELLDLAARWRGEGKRVAAATVVSTWGSAPRPPGGRLVVCEDGRFAGSVSGGCIENEVITAAYEAMQTANRNCSISASPTKRRGESACRAAAKSKSISRRSTAIRARRFCANGKRRFARARRALF